MIGIFDSGVGGLSIYKEVKKALPEAHTLFVADQKFVPYGEKTKAELLDRVARIIDFLLGQGAKLVVMACNTATVFTLEEMRECFHVPMVGVVPAVKPAVEHSLTKKIAVMCTARTAVSAYLRVLVFKFAAGCEVMKIGCPGLVECVERGEVGSNEVDALVAKYLDQAKECGVDAVVLGSTHYPFVRPAVERFMGPSVAVIDSGVAVAHQTARIYMAQGLPMAGGGRGEEGVDAPPRVTIPDNFFTTGDAEKFSPVASALLGRIIVGTHTVV